MGMGMDMGMVWAWVWAWAWALGGLGSGTVLEQASRRVGVEACIIDSPFKIDAIQY